MNLQGVSHGCDYQIVDNVEAEAGFGHIACELACVVKFGFEPGHHCKAHKPAVEGVERAAQVFRGGVVLAEGCDYQYDTGNGRAYQEGAPYFF